MEGTCGEVQVRLRLGDLRDHAWMVESGYWLANKETALDLSVKLPGSRIRKRLSSLTAILSRRSRFKVPAPEQSTLPILTLSDADPAEAEAVDVYMWQPRYIDESALSSEGQSALPGDGDLKTQGRGRFGSWVPLQRRLFRSASRGPKLLKMPRPSARTCHQGLRAAIIQLDTGAHVQIWVHEKEDSPGREQITWAPATRIDVYREVILGSFVDPYHNDFYFWQCWEMTRRLLQSGSIVLVQLAFGNTVGIVWAVLVAFVSIIMQCHFRPYKDRDMNTLMTSVLANTFLMYASIWYFHTETQNNDVHDGEGLWVGVAMLLMQLLMISYGMCFLTPLLKPVQKMLVDAKAHVNRRFSPARKNEMSRNAYDGPGWSSDLHGDQPAIQSEGAPGIEVAGTEGAGMEYVAQERTVNCHNPVYSMTVTAAIESYKSDSS
ncbi:hypothetical protein CYMTET_11357 [Cymbomonas tetramitiformis]|uniref:Uncharacterized protein n=1 Tax=Cymbomonas tetramitiformis TaxID=36881 RepID=A0AAE0GMV6_9CHLO|nr:hypothetical protein CYMTET_11357 [Cymbomonas tetramitiformis]